MKKKRKLITGCLVAVMAMSNIVVQYPSNMIETTMVTAKAAKQSNVKYYGSYKNVKWKVYKSGLLEVKASCII